MSTSSKALSDFKSFLFIAPAVTIFSVFYIFPFFYIFIRLAQAGSEASANFSNVKLNLPGLKNLYEWQLKLKDSEGQEKLPIKILKNEPIEVEFHKVSLKY